MSGGLEELLDSVADAVSSLVVFATEKHNDRNVVLQLRVGVGRLQEAAKFLASEVSVTADLWYELGNSGMSNRNSDDILTLEIWESKSRIAANN